ncbi:MAG: hypothetical protein HYS12_03415, partial [Planctomycetes bacterium]|nr:hypothetical protein [Planctomycetota bacterium]
LSFFSSDLGPIALATSESLGLAGSGQGQVGDLLPLQDTFVATAAVLLTVRLESEALPARLEQEVVLAAGPETGVPEFVRLLLNRLGDQARGTEEGGAPDPEEPGGPPIDRDALLDLVTGRKETSALRPAVTREDVLNTTRSAAFAPGMPPVRQLLDEWMPGSAAALDTLWQRVADGSLRLGETATAALGPAIAPVRETMLLLPELPLREMVDGVAEGVLEAVRAAADVAGSQLAPAWEGTSSPPKSVQPRKGEAPAEPPATEEKDLPPARPGDQSRREPPHDAPKDEAAMAASLVAALFGSGSYTALTMHSTVCGGLKTNRRPLPSSRTNSRKKRSMTALLGDG